MTIVNSGLKGLMSVMLARVSFIWYDICHAKQEMVGEHTHHDCVEHFMRELLMYPTNVAH